MIIVIKRGLQKPNSGISREKGHTDHPRINCFRKSYGNGVVYSRVASVRLTKYRFTAGNKWVSEKYTKASSEWPLVPFKNQF